MAADCKYASKYNDRHNNSGVLPDKQLDKGQVPGPFGGKRTHTDCKHAKIHAAADSETVELGKEAEEVKS